MDRTSQPVAKNAPVHWKAYLQLLKPVTWFPPMWAFGCGLVASGASLGSRGLFVVGGIALAGPLVCGTSQIVNDWFDRKVDAINEPDRPIPSGRVPGRNGLYFAILWTVVSLMVAATLGVWVLAAAVFGLLLAWAYSAPPFRLKMNGWWGNSAVAICYEGLPWFTAAAVLSGTLPTWHSIFAALAYSVGAHGIMTLNDFKAINGDIQMGIRTLPVQLGANGAARVACAVMAVAQLAVIALLFYLDTPIHAGAVTGLLAVQLVLMRRFLSDPIKFAQWYSAFGVTLYVSGMLITAFAIRQVVAA
ncbi:MAG: chlorophyll synthase ChlG [Gammaproteobacteria bacterium]